MATSYVLKMQLNQREWNGKKQRAAERVRRNTKRKWKIEKIDSRLKQSNLYNYMREKQIKKNDASDAREKKKHEKTIWKA